MAETRLRGQEVSLRITSEGEMLSQVTAFKDFTVQFDLATLEEGYLGETEKRFDDIAHGSSGSMTVDAEGSELLELIQTIVERAQRRRDIREKKINTTARFSFPNGDRPKLNIGDMKFDAIPLAIPARDQYVNATLSYKAPIPRFVGL